MAKRDPFFEFKSFWGPIFRFKQVKLTSESQNGSNLVRLTSKRVQIRVQPYKALLINLIWTRPDPFLSRFGLALRVKIPVKFGSGWSGSFIPTNLDLVSKWLWPYCESFLMCAPRRLQTRTRGHNTAAAHCVKIAIFFMSQRSFHCCTSIATVSFCNRGNGIFRCGKGQFG